MDVRTIASPIKQSPHPVRAQWPGRAKIKDVLTPPATKDPPWKRTGRDVLWPCGWIFWSNPTPATHSYCQFTEKKRARIQEWIQISSCPSVRHLKDYHQILRRIIIHGISCWWKKALPSYVFIFRNWQSIVFHEKKNLGSRDWCHGAAAGERVIRDVIIWSFWGCLKFKLRTTEHLSF